MKVFLLVLYAAAFLTIGVITMRRTRTLGDFFLGNRQIGPWMSAFAYGTTYFSAVLFVGYAGRIGWSFGLSGLWIALGNTLVGSLLAWLVLARRTREMTIRLHAMTMPEFLGARYADKRLKIFAALVIFIFLVPYSGSVYIGLSYLFEQVFHLPYLAALLLMTVLTLVYLVMGGYLAVNLTDFVQGLIMLGGAALMVRTILLRPEVGGLMAGMQKLAAIDPALASPVGPPGPWPLLHLVLLTSLGTWGLPQMVQKFYSIKSEAAVRPAAIVSTLFAGIITFSAYFFGSLTRLFFKALPLAGGKPNADLLVPQLITLAMPDWLAAILLLLVLSASMSTLSSLVLVASSAVGMDLFQGVWWPKLSGQAMVRLMRVLCGFFIVLSFALAVTRPAFILSLMALSWGTVAGVFLAPYLYGLYWKGTTRAGAWAGALSGLAISLGFAWWHGLDPAMVTLSGVLAMVVPLAVVPLVSLVTKPFPVEHLSRVFGPAVYGRDIALNREQADLEP
ncbi:MAG: sodium/solute symporter [Bacillota bacterium]|nr:sodium/solute symporter [Bacillota bacterium]